MNANVSSGIIRALAMSSALLACSALQAAEGNWSPPRTADGKPVISGIWTNASVTNLTRPPGVTKLVVTRDEAEALVKANPFQRLIEADSGPSDLNDNLLEDKNADRGYNAFWVDPGNFLANVNGEYRTSWIVEPANGQMPLSDAGRQLAEGGARGARRAALPGSRGAAAAGALPHRVQRRQRPRHAQPDVQQQLPDRADAAGGADPGRDGARRAHHSDREGQGDRAGFAPPGRAQPVVRRSGRLVGRRHAGRRDDARESRSRRARARSTCPSRAR